MIGPIDKELLEEVLNGLSDRVGNPHLTPREFDVCLRLLEGVSYPVIATDLSITSKTIEAHVAHAASKIGIDKRQLFRYSLFREYFYAAGRRDESKCQEDGRKDPQDILTMS